MADPYIRLGEPHHVADPDIWQGVKCLFVGRGPKSVAKLDWGRVVGHCGILSLGSDSNSLLSLIICCRILCTIVAIGVEQFECVR